VVLRGASLGGGRVAKSGARVEDPGAGRCRRTLPSLQRGARPHTTQTQSVQGHQDMGAHSPSNSSSQATTKSKSCDGW
jgi:hypothetical protein